MGLVDEVRGAMYPSMAPEFLREDLLELDLVTGYTVDVGWIPQCDRKGHFRIVVFKDFWTNINAETSADSPDDAIDFLKWFIREYGTQEDLYSSELGAKTPSISESLSYSPDYIADSNNNESLEIVPS